MLDAGSPDGRYLASAGEDQSVLVWDRAQMPLIGHTGRVDDVTFDPSGHQLASVGQRGALLIWGLAAAPGGVPIPRAIQASD